VVKAAVTNPARFRLSLGDVMYIAAGQRRDAGGGGGAGSVLVVLYSLVEYEKAIS
jgi:hypothetical protein